MNKQNKINFIKEWYEFRENMCVKYRYNCEECLLYESTDRWWGENGKYESVYNCKYDFEEAYAVEIIELMESLKGANKDE